MKTVMTTITDIDARLARIESEIEDLERQIGDLEEEAEELRGAKATFLRYFGSNQLATVDDDVIDSDLSKQQAMVMRAVPRGAGAKVKPAEIIKQCRSLDASYIRTTLWRFAQDGRLESADGYYWRKGR